MRLLFLICLLEMESQLAVLHSRKLLSIFIILGSPKCQLIMQHILVRVVFIIFSRFLKLQNVTTFMNEEFACLE